MNTIDQNNSLASLQKALLPAPALIDSRTEKDLLFFLARFARLINFYDTQNNHSGSWEPMLLKDPVFLLATICYTDVAAMHTLYLDTCNNLHEDDPSTTFNQLFDQLTAVFMQIKPWIYYMQRSSDEYELKKYMSAEIKNTFSRYFWALLSLRQNLFLSKVIPGITPVDTSSFYWFPQYDEIIWKQNKDKDPYWQVLDLQSNIRENTTQQLLTAICRAGDKVFHFLDTIVRQANTAFNTMENSKSHYPDTTLLRTFIHLLQVEQQQLNQLTDKHLQFYYRTILQQQQQPALADKVFLTATLTSTHTPFLLPAGTLFSAGNKQPLLFATTTDVTLNPATISNAYTLTTAPNGCYLNHIPTPALLKKDASGKILDWDTFGTTTNRSALGLAFASPLLLLREGERSIWLTIEFTTAVPAWLLENAVISLSTAHHWLDVTEHIYYHLPSTNLVHHVVIECTLPVTTAPIVPFTVHPDGISSNWPMMKITFTDCFNLITPPVISNLQLEVRVKKMRSVQLYNDYGGLSTQTPFALFGPAPAANSHFIVGSNEIFSKPLTNLQLTLNWDTLPTTLPCEDAFAEYYQPYNQYVHNKMQEVPPEKKPNCFTRLFKRRKKTAIPTPYLMTPFHNECFKVNFQLLQNQSWMPLTTGGPLFAVETCMDGKTQLKPYSSYSYNGYLPPADCDASIQLTPLQLTPSSVAGFIRMDLDDPIYGFGAGLYPAVVTQATYNNATAIARHPKDPVAAIVVNPPFTPKAASVEVTYTAKVNCLQDQYPFEYFLYAPFGNYALPYQKDYQYTIGQTTASNGYPLYPSLLYKGYLLLELAHLVTATTTNLYFELTGSKLSDMADTDLFYLSSTGWKPLPVLSDSTKGLSCSGIITVNIPADISSHSLVMPADKYWIAITTNRDPRSISRTVMLSTNGFVAQRTAGSLPKDGTTPHLPANSITRTQYTVPPIATVTQSFPSFGGRAAEDEKGMNMRVSSRLKTKDRAVSGSDYTALIRQQFPEVYFSKTVFNPTEKTTSIYAIRAFKNQAEPNAFVPFLTACQQGDIQAFIADRASAFARPAVQRFDKQYVQVVTRVFILPGYEKQGIQDKLHQLLDLFLSPWISTHTPQAVIDQPVTDAQVARCINTVPGIKGIAAISFNTWTTAGMPENVQTVTPFTASSLLISSMDHLIECIEPV